MFYLYQFHLALLLLRIVEVDIPALHNPYPHYIPLIITNPRAPTPQPSPSGSPKERNISPLGKKIKIEKGKENELKDSEDEMRGGR